MENQNSGAAKKGRPAQPKQTLPIFMGVAQSRMKMEVVISTSIGRELRSYIKWGSIAAGLAEDEALCRFIDKAVGDLLKRDLLWRDERNDAMRADAAQVIRHGEVVERTAPAPAPAPAAPRPASVPVSRPAVATVAPSPAGKVG